jgi:hypothetical protein
MDTVLNTLHNHSATSGEIAPAPENQSSSFTCFIRGNFSGGLAPDQKSLTDGK